MRQGFNALFWKRFGNGAIDSVALGVRIEDLCAVTDAGCEILTSIDKQLTVVD